MFSDNAIENGDRSLLDLDYSLSSIELVIIAVIGQIAVYIFVLGKLDLGKSSLEIAVLYNLPCYKGNCM